MRIKASTYQLMAALFALILSSSVASGSVEYHNSSGEGDSYSQGTLFCNDRIQVSFDATCIIELNADQILEGDPMGSYDDFILEIFEGTPPSLERC